jgi:hypothetical protein
MNQSGAMTSGCAYGQYLVDQTPRYDNARRRRRPRRESQVLSPRGIIRPDKRKKPKYH